MTKYINDKDTQLLRNGVGSIDPDILLSKKFIHTIVLQRTPTFSSWSLSSIVIS